MAVKPKAVPYTAVILWECPECGATWQARHRPRAGAQLVCAAMSEQRQVNVAGFLVQPCGSVSVSAGRRKGIAPNVSL